MNMIPEATAFLETCNGREKDAFTRIIVGLPDGFRLINHVKGPEECFIHFQYPFGPSSDRLARPSIRLVSRPARSARSHAYNEGPFSSLDEIREETIMIENGAWAARYSLATPTALIISALLSR